MNSLPHFTGNAFNYCHGGALTTYVDVATTIGLYAFDLKSRGHVSSKLDMDFLSPGKTETEEGKEDGPSVLVDAKINKIGKILGFTEATIYEEESEIVICKGSHIKAFIDSEWKV